MKNKISLIILGLLGFSIVSCDDETALNETLIMALTEDPKPAEKAVVETIETKNWAIAIHGGAGYISPGRYDAEEEEAYLDALDEALKIGEEALKSGSPALEVVQQVIMHLEDNPLFNAGRGAVLTNSGTAELDASLMDGRSLNAGAVAGVKTIKNPILAARYVMDSTKHVLLSGDGVEGLVGKAGLEMVKNEYFITQEHREELKSIQKHGTVGCVVLDRGGNLAAGTSTGGMMNKQWGRIGDSPIIGAGTYADNSTCAVSCTGHGEYFIRKSIAHDIHARMKYGKQNLATAAKGSLDELSDMNALGGFVAVDKNGKVAMLFNTEGMFRAYSTEDQRVVEMYK